MEIPVASIYDMVRARRAKEQAKELNIRKNWYHPPDPHKTAELLDCAQKPVKKPTKTEAKKMATKETVTMPLGSLLAPHVVTASHMTRKQTPPQATQSLNQAKSEMLDKLVSQMNERMRQEEERGRQEITKLAHKYMGDKDNTSAMKMESKQLLDRLLSKTKQPTVELPTDMMVTLNTSKSLTSNKIYADGISLIPSQASKLELKQPVKTPKKKMTHKTTKKAKI